MVADAGLGLSNQGIGLEINFGVKCHMIQMRLQYSKNKVCGQNRQLYACRDITNDVEGLRRIDIPQ